MGKTFLGAWIDSRQVYLGARLPVALSSRQKPRFLPAETQLISDKRSLGDRKGAPKGAPKGAVRGRTAQKSAAGDFFPVN
jgi:hypothetical protein